MAGISLKAKIRKILTKAYPSDLDVHVLSGWRDDVHVITASQELSKKRWRERVDLLWSVFEKQLTPEEWGRIAISMIVPPEKLAETLSQERAGIRPLLKASRGHGGSRNGQAKVARR